MIDPRKKAIAGRIVVQATKPAQTFSTQMQSPSFRRRILDAAKRDGSLHTLYWHIEFRSPVSLLPPWLKAQNPLTGSVVFVASHPGKHIPVIPVGSDPAISMEYAELLKGWMHSRNRWVQDIGIALMPADLLRGLKWYEWGDRLPPVTNFADAAAAWANACARPRAWRLWLGMAWHICHAAASEHCVAVASKEHGG